MKNETNKGIIAYAGVAMVASCALSGYGIAAIVKDIITKRWQSYLFRWYNGFEWCFCSNTFRHY